MCPKIDVMERESKNSCPKIDVMERESKNLEFESDLNGA
jgi:hypothetical protein